jgi:hypothetical protein
MLGKGAQEELNKYQRDQIEVLQTKYRELDDKFDRVISLMLRVEGDFNTRNVKSNDQAFKSDILTDIFYSWKEIYEKKH